MPEEDQHRVGLHRQLEHCRLEVKPMRLDQQVSPEAKVTIGADASGNTLGNEREIVVKRNNVLIYLKCD